MKHKTSIKFYLSAFLLIIFSSYTPLKAQRKEAIKLNDKGVEIYMKVLGLKLPKDSMKLASSFYKSSIKKDQTYKVPYVNLWTSSNHMNDYSSSIAVCSQWLLNNPKDVDMLLKRGMLYELRKNDQLAQSDFKKSMQIMNVSAYPLDGQITKERKQKIAELLFSLFVADRDGKSFETFSARVRALSDKGPEIENVLRLTKETDRVKYIKSVTSFRDNS